MCAKVSDNQVAHCRSGRLLRRDGVVSFLAAPQSRSTFSPSRIKWVHVGSLIVVRLT